MTWMGDTYIGKGTIVEEMAGINSPVVGSHKCPDDDGVITSPKGSGGREGGVRSAASNKGGEGGRLAKPGGGPLLDTGRGGVWVGAVSAPSILTKEEARSDIVMLPLPVSKTVQNTQNFTKHRFAKRSQLL